MLDFQGTEVEHLVEKVIVHPDYNHLIVDNDVALLKISIVNDEAEDFHRSRSFVDFLSRSQKQKRGSKSRRSRHFRRVTPSFASGGKRRYKPSALSFSSACLPDQDETPPEGATCTILGWGKEKHTDDRGSTKLKEAKVPITSKDKCLNVYKDYFISDNMFCAGGGATDTCNGDSGGPLICQKDGRWTIYGITSFGEDCGINGKFGIYAKVPKFTEWIQREISRIY